MDTSSYKPNALQWASLWALVGMAVCFIIITLCLAWMIFFEASSIVGRISGLVLCHFLVVLPGVFFKVVLGMATDDRRGWPAVWKTLGLWIAVVPVVSAIGFLEDLVMGSFFGAFGLGLFGMLLGILGGIYQSITGRGMQWNLRIRLGGDGAESDYN